ncbi:hemolysin [Planococcus lenghuensis]|uniref:Hemolysin n=1 Tax=Planococcus lenghuensis TaxID=2213202 RepID=A0A1Q2L4Y5_9BACL|nr:hemolysin III family protein [Planococcus lenghuensis]AQQ54952.1 hemolysin [Planococcus lenghuensis]
MKVSIREPFNALSHLIGAVLAFIACAAMIAKAIEHDVPLLHTAAVTVFGLTLIFLYSASTTYHWVKEDSKTINYLRRIDHSMIYVLITGSYAPFCLIALGGTLGWTILIISCALAITGILLTMTSFNSHRKLTTILYIAMGWIIILALEPLADNLTRQALVLLISGGVLYTIGGVLYGIEKALNNRNYHKIFHIFTLFGSFAHFAVVYFYLL